MESGKGSLMDWKTLLEDPVLSKKAVRKILFIITFTVVLVYIVFHLEQAGWFIGWAFSLISPFLIGIAVAFVLNVLLKLFEERIFGFLKRKNSRVWRKCGRAVCVSLTFLTVLLLLGGIIFFVLPELVRSVRVLTDAIPSYAQSFTEWLNQTLTRLDLDQLKDTVMKIDWTNMLSNATQATTDLVGSIANATIGFASGIFTFIMSLIFSVYMLFSKEKLMQNCKRVLYAYLPRRTAYHLIEVGSLSNSIFAGFVTGQLTEGVILGVLCYIGMNLIQLPYALLISVIVSLTSLVPILGAYLGGAVGAFILLIINPLDCLWFLIFLVVLQQFEGNVIYPRVVGTSIGLPGIWVLLAILVGGGLAGIPGVLIGVPLFSVLYALLRSGTTRQLRKKQLTNEDVRRNTPPKKPAPPEHDDAPLFSDTP